MHTDAHIVASCSETSFKRCTVGTVKARGKKEHYVHDL